MSYVIVVYSPEPIVSAAGDASLSWSPSGLYSGGIGGVPASYYDLPDAIEAAERANRVYGRDGDNTARYTVHYTHHYVTSCALPPARGLSPVAGIPSGSADVPVTTGWGDETFNDAAGALPLAVLPVAVSALPLDPNGPIVLSDGTPCAVHHSSYPGSAFHILPLRPSSLLPGIWSWRRVDAESGKVFHSEVYAQNVVLNPDAMRFEVRCGINGTDRNEWGTVAEFLSGKEAADWIKANRERYANKSLVVVRSDPKAIAADWREREAMRLSDGTYTPLPGDWGNVIAGEYPDHFAHVAQSDKRKVAFTESASSGERDKQKVLSAHLYAQRYLASRMYGDQTGRFVADMMGDSVKVCLSPLGDADALERLYVECDSSVHGVSSCMSHSADDYSSPFHPVRVYADGGDLTMAFLRDDGDGGVDLSGQWDADGAIMARCLAWPERKEYSRVYGETTAARMLRTALENDGYRQTQLVGAKLAKEEYHGDLVMPYLDCGEGHFTDHGDYLTVGGSEPAGSTSGLVEYVERVCCERCDESVREDDTGSVLINRYDAEYWCSDCLGNHSSTCEQSYVRVSDDATAEVYMSGRSYASTVASWLLEDGTIEAALCNDGVWREDYFVCEDCSEVMASGCEHIEHTECCDSCGDEREAVAAAEQQEQVESVSLAA